MRASFVNIAPLDAARKGNGWIILGDKLRMMNMPERPVIHFAREQVFWLHRTACRIDIETRMNHAHLECCIDSDLFRLCVRDAFRDVLVLRPCLRVVASST